MAPAPVGLALLAALAAPDPTPAPARNLVVLVDSTSLPAGVDQPLAAALQKEVLRSARYTWLEAPPLTVEELVMALSCRKPDEKCLQRVLPMLKADAVVLASVPGGKTPDVQLLMVETGVKLARKASVPRGSPDVLVPALAQALRDMLGPRKPAVLVVVTEPPGALVLLDGAAHATSPTTLTDLPLGNHHVEVALAGYLPQSVDVSAEPGEQREVRLTLVAPPPPAPEPLPPAPAPVAAAPVAAPAGLVAPVKWGLVGLGGLGVALSGLGVLAGVGMLVASGAVYALVWNVQAAIKFGNPLVYPLSAGGGSALGVALLLVPLGVALVVGPLGADLVLRARG